MRQASFQPSLASFFAYGNVAFVSASVDVRGTPPGMFATAMIRVPAVPATAQPSSRPSTQDSALRTQGSQTATRNSQLLQQALQPYLQSSDLLAHDKSDTVPTLLASTADLLGPLAADPALRDAHARLAAAVKETPGEDIKALRECEFGNIGIMHHKVRKSHTQWFQKHFATLSFLDGEPEVFLFFPAGQFRLTDFTTLNAGGTRLKERVPNAIGQVRFSTDPALVLDDTNGWAAGTCRLIE